MSRVYELQRYLFFFNLWTARGTGNKAGYFISLWTPFDIILHSLPGNPNYFAISLKLRLMSLTGTFTREKILSRLNVLLHFSGLPDCTPPCIIEEKIPRYLIPIEAATRFSQHLSAHWDCKDQSPILAKSRYISAQEKTIAISVKILKFQVFCCTLSVRYLVEKFPSAS